MDKTLKQLKEKLRAIAGEWNGDESCDQEDRAVASLEGIDLIERLEEIIKELEINE